MTTQTSVAFSDAKTAKRVRIGFLAPCIAFDTYPLCLYQVSPEGVLWLCASNSVAEFDRESFERNLEMLESRVSQLAKDGAEYIIVGGSPSFRGKGPDFAAKIANDLSEKVGVTVALNALTPIDALRRLGVERLAIASPYPDWTNEEMKNFFVQTGFEVTGHAGMTLGKIVEIADVPSSRTLELIIEAAHAGGNPQAIYVPGARLHVVDVIGQAEKELGIPVVTAATSMIWSALTHLNWNGDQITMFGKPFSEYGKLMETIVQE